jgi:hypothetical protein
MYKEPNHDDLYDSLREEIIENSLSFSRKITAFAMLEELSDLHAMFCYSQQELSDTKDDKLIIISHRIINKLREFVDDMGEYGIDDHSLATFLELTERFQSVIKNQSTVYPKVVINN